MKITKDKLVELRACEEGIEWFKRQSFEEIEHDKFIDLLIKKKDMLWVCWLIPHLLNKKNNVRFAVYCAELALPLFEKEHPGDKRPKKAIETAKKWLDDPSKENNDAAAKAAADAAKAAKAANAAAYAAYAAAYAADAAVYAANAAAYAANSAAYYAAVYAAIEIKTKIMDYGLELINQQEMEIEHEK